MNPVDPARETGDDERARHRPGPGDGPEHAPAEERAEGEYSEDASSRAGAEGPAGPVSPADVGALTITLPGVAELPLLQDGRVVSRPGQAPGALSRVFEARGGAVQPDPQDAEGPDAADQDGAVQPEHAEEPEQPEYTVASDGVPLGPDGQPLTRRQLRELRRRQEAAASGAPSTSGAAEAAAGDVTRESLAREATALAERLAAAGQDPAAVDPDLLREQEVLAEKARRFNETGALATVPAPATGADRAEQPVAHEPVQARAAHGLDSLSASEWGSRERTLLIVAAVVFVVLLVALIVALVL